MVCYNVRSFILYGVKTVITVITTQMLVFEMCINKKQLEDRQHLLFTLLCLECLVSAGKCSSRYPESRDFRNLETWQTLAGTVDNFTLITLYCTLWGMVRRSMRTPKPKTNINIRFERKSNYQWYSVNFVTPIRNQSWKIKSEDKLQHWMNFFDLF